MDRKQKMSVAAIGIAIMSLAVACAAASSQTFNTPLYTLRMERASSKMNFLPTAQNAFTYTTENGYMLNYNVSGECCGVISSRTNINPTCWPETCFETCPWTCFETCPPYTCDETSCQDTCSTCDQWTCGGWTCVSTCESCQPPC